jgi:DNA-binding beta-propeller fold protein YncE
MGQLLSGQLSVGTAPSRIDGQSNNPVVLHIHNNDNTDNLYIGNESVKSTTGMIIPKLDSIELTLHQGNTIWCVSTKNNHTVSWIAQVL